MKKTTRLLTLVTASLALTFSAGCMQMILDANKKIEPIAFNILPPTEDDFVMLIPDEQIQANIIGSWKGSTLGKGFSEVDINENPFMYINTPDVTGEDEVIFNKDGSFYMSVVTRTQNVQTKEITENSIKQNGTWACKDGLLILKSKDQQTGKENTCSAVAIWHDDGRMEFRLDVDSLKKTAMDNMAASNNMDVQNGLKDMKFYYDKDGAFYSVIVIEMTQRGISSRAKVTSKLMPKFYSKQGK